jgi:hypothetical protein
MSVAGDPCGQSKTHGAGRYQEKAVGAEGRSRIGMRLPPTVFESVSNRPTPSGINHRYSSATRYSGAESHTRTAPVAVRTIMDFAFNGGSAEGSGGS